MAAEAILGAAQNTAQGRARLALVAALADVPGWFDPTSPEPARTDYATQQANQFLWLEFVDLPFQFAFRAELEFRAGGNPSFNTGVGYERQLATQPIMQRCRRCTRPPDLAWTPILRC